MNLKRETLYSFYDNVFFPGTDRRLNIVQLSTVVTPPMHQSKAEAWRFLESEFDKWGTKLTHRHVLLIYLTDDCLNNDPTTLEMVKEHLDKFHSRLMEEHDIKCEEIFEILNYVALFSISSPPHSIKEDLLPFFNK